MQELTCINASRNIRESAIKWQYVERDTGWVRNLTNDLLFSFINITNLINNVKHLI